MDTLTRLLLLCLSGLVGGSPPGDAFEVYARRFAREYEPYMFAAIPLHAPVPVLRVLTRAPLRPPAPRRDAQAAPSALHAAYARPLPPARLYPQEPLYRAGPEPAYEATSYDYVQEYAAPRPSRPQKPRRQVAPVLEYAAEYDTYAPQPPPTYALAPYEPAAYAATQEAAPTVLYARPSPSGGFTYRRVAGEAAAPKKRAPLKEKDPPFIVKIHKYRIVKDDLI